MLAIPRMKSILNSQFSPLSPCLCRTKKTTPFALMSMASQSIICNNPFRIHNHLHLMSTSLSNYLICSIQSRNLHTEASRPPSGEVHVVVGSMFAGKTTRLLRRIQLENSSGRLELWNGMGMNCDRHCSDIPSFQVKSQKKDPNLDKILKALCISGRLSEAIGLLCCTGLPVHERTYSLLLQECIFRKEYKKGRRIHAQMIVVGYIPNEYLKTKLLILYVKSGCLEIAHILFNNLAEKCLISWNVMIAGYVQRGLEELGLYFFYGMRQTGLRPDQYTFASVFRACATLTALEPGKQAHGVMFKCRIMENVIVNSALIDMYFKCSSISDGQQVFDKCSIRNTITWTALIAGYGLHGRVMEVLGSFNRMKSEGFRPNYVTFLAVLTACSHGGLVDEGWEYFLSMERDYEIVPRAQHYAAMVDLLGRAGKLKEAYDFVLTSPCKEHSVIWGALLGACKIHGDMNLLRLASKEFFKLEPVNTGKYIVLANAYATSGLWDNVMEVRDVMRESGMTKEPAYSRIDIQYKVFFFFKGDKSHEQSDEIYEVVKKMTDILKDACIPDVSGD